MFLSTPPRGERPARGRLPSAGQGRFYPRPREGSDSDEPVGHRRSRRFYPRPREGSDPYQRPTWLREIEFLSTPPRGERLALMSKPVPLASVSIHAPARGATGSRRLRIAGHARFYPRPREGSDCRAAGASRPNSGFYPRPREGSDPAASRVTRTCPTFLSTPPRGERRCAVDGGEMAGEFLSTPPRGERPCRNARRARSRHVSIHAPARGATPIHRASGRFCGVSIHAPARGATRSCHKLVKPGSFLSTPPRGERRPCPDARHHIFGVSIHAPARGATEIGRNAYLRRGVSIHAPARGATSRAMSLARRSLFLSVKRHPELPPLRHEELPPRVHDVG